MADCNSINTVPNWVTQEDASSDNYSPSSWSNTNVQNSVGSVNYYEPVQTQFAVNSSEGPELNQTRANSTSAYSAVQNQNEFMFTSSCSPSKRSRLCQDELQTSCESPSCIAEHARLEAKVQKLSSDYQILLTSHKVMREGLIEKDIVQEARKRLETEHGNEIAKLKNTIWALENESKTLKADNDAYKYMITKLNSDLSSIQDKVYTLCQESNNCGRIGEYTLKGPSGSLCITVNDTISRIQRTLDQELKRKQMLTLYENVTPIGSPICGDTNRNVSRFQTTDQSVDDVDIKNELPRTLDPTTDNGQPQDLTLCCIEVVNEDIIEGQACGGNADVVYINVETGQPAVLPLQVQVHDQEDDSDDDITVIDEVQNTSKAGAIVVPILSNTLKTEPSPSFLNPKHYMNFEKPGFFCICGQQFDEQKKLDMHLRSNVGKLNCVVCKRTFITTQGLQKHLKDHHQIIVADSCKLCGETFKTRDQLVFHEKTVHYGSVSEHPRMLDAVSLACSGGSSSNRLTFTASLDASNNQLVSIMPSTHSLLCNPSSASNDSHENTEQVTGMNATIPSTANANLDYHNNGLVIYSHGPAPITISSANDLPVHRNNAESPPATATFHCNFSENTNKHEVDAVKSSEGDLMWCTCGSKYTSKPGLLRHISAQSQPSNFVCGSCNEQFGSFHKVASHMAKCSAR